MTEVSAQQEKIKVAAIDPGEHIGFAFFTGESLKMSGMFSSSNRALRTMFDLIDDFKPDELVVESFRLYPHKALQQSWSSMRTPEIIGIIKYWAWENNYRFVLQPATCKQAFPDARLKQMDLYVPNIHTRDAIRHGLYRQRFGRKKGGAKFANKGNTHSVEPRRGENVH